MTFLSASHDTARHPWLAAKLADMFARGVAFFALLGAAARVSQSIETGREPAGDDLAMLGIAGPLPKVR